MSDVETWVSTALTSQHSRLASMGWSGGGSGRGEGRRQLVGFFGRDSLDSKPCFGTPVGGETEALERLKKFAAEWQAQPNKAKISNTDSIYGANFSCKVSPWLSTGCLSPRFIFEELKSRTISAASSRNNSPDSADGGGNWLMFELLWRDFFRFITMKCSSAMKMVQAAPSSACTAALP